MRVGHIDVDRERVSAFFSGEQLEVASLPCSLGMSILLLQIYAKKIIIDT